MSDSEIIALFWRRCEDAIAETDKKYGAYCHSIAFHILYSDEDAQECVNDTYLRAWDAIPPQRPQRFCAFLGKITRNLSLDYYKRNHADKRGAGQVTLALSELGECVGSTGDVESSMDEQALATAIETFLKKQSPQKRSIFILRYWELCPIREIARMQHISEAKVSTILHRMRKGLKQQLSKEGIFV